MGKLPTEKLNQALNGTDFVPQAITCLQELSAQGKPETEAELQQRIDAYFQFCADRRLKPGVEALALSLGIDRTTFWTWCRGMGGKSEQWGALCRSAKQTVIAFTEAAAQSGHLSPPIAIFALKNVAGWRDQIDVGTFETMEKPQKTTDDIAREMGIIDIDM